VICIRIDAKAPYAPIGGSAGFWANIDRTAMEMRDINKKELVQYMESQPLETRCQFSKIVIPGDANYAEIAATYTGSVAGILGFGTSDIEDIQRCTEGVVTWAINYSRAENEKISVEVSCELIPEGFKIAVNDRGLPFDLSLVADPESMGLAGIFRLKGNMDEIVFNNLGPGGKEILLIKYKQQGPITDFFNACELESATSVPETKPVRLRNVDLTFRPMRPEEAIEVSKCVYKGYGYTYPHEHIYYPTKLAELNRNGHISSAVAVNGKGEIVGHCALLNKSADGRTAEIGMGVVKPEYRAIGCFNKLAGFLVAQARREDLTGLYVQAVAVHKYSQRTAAKLALKETAMLLAYIPPSVDFKRMNESRSQRTTAFLCFRYLQKPSRPLVYAPAKHRRMIVTLYKYLGISPIIKAPTGLAESTFEAKSQVHIKVENAIGYARIMIENYGNDIVREISKSMTQLCLNKIEVLNLYLNLSDSRTGFVAEIMEQMGFFFSGILPGSMSKGSDALILQYLNNVPSDYDAVQAHSAMGRKLLAYVSDHQPEGNCPGFLN
jgi:serine/threonine-protein kinase RsbW